MHKHGCVFIVYNIYLAFSWPGTTRLVVLHASSSAIAITRCVECGNIMPHLVHFLVSFFLINTCTYTMCADGSDLPSCPIWTYPSPSGNECVCGGGFYNIIICNPETLTVQLIVKFFCFMLFNDNGVNTTLLGTCPYDDSVRLPMNFSMSQLSLNSMKQKNFPVSCTVKVSWLQAITCSRLSPQTHSLPEVLGYVQVGRYELSAHIVNMSSGKKLTRKDTERGMMLGCQTLHT